MNRIITFDIESNNLLDEKGIDYTSMPYKLSKDYKIHCICAQDVKTKEEFSFVQEDCRNFVEFLREECTYICQYNGLDFDLMVLRLFYGMKYQVQPNAHHRLNINDPHEPLPDRLFNKKVRFVDLLVLSKLLNPDRLPGHKLDDWGKTLKYKKGDYGKKEEAWDKFTPEMLEYCRQDVRLTTKVYEALIKEAGDHDWRESYDLELCTRDIVSTKSQHLGFKLDQELANWCVEDLLQKKQEIEDKVEPLLPKRILPKGDQLSLPKTLWKQPFPTKEPFTTTGNLKKPVRDYLGKINIPEEMQRDFICSMLEKKDVEGVSLVENFIQQEIPKHKSLLSTHAINFCVKDLNIEDEGLMFDAIVEYDNGKELPVMKEDMKLSHKAEVKKWLVEKGWEPQNFNERDLTLDSKKRKRDKQKYEEAVEKYAEETLNSPYCKFRCEFLKTSPKNLKKFLLKKRRNRPVKVRTTPKYIKNQDKDLCDGLVNMGKKFSFVKDIVFWLTYDHRLNTIKSPNGTGWLNESRLNQDGHVSTPADTLGAITGRFTHRKIVNCPRATSLYGEYMRGMLTVDDECYEIGFDADGLEARAEGALVYKYPGGPEYVEKLIGKKPNDLHTLNAKKFNVSRDESKTLKYSLSYGAGAPKVAQQTGWKEGKAKKVIDEYWKEAAPAKLLIDAIKRHWESNNKEFIIGIDKRKLIARAPHILFNLALQNLGITAMKRAHLFCDRMMKEEGLLCDPFENDIKSELLACPIINYHDEQQQAVNRGLVRLKYFQTKEEASVYKVEVESKGKFILSDVAKGFEEPHLDEYFVGWSRIGELMVKGLTMAGDYYNLAVPLTSGYQIGTTWKHCH